MLHLKLCECCAGTVLCCAVLCCAVLCCAVLCCAVYYLLPVCSQQVGESCFSNLPIKLDRLARLCHAVLCYAVLCCAVHCLLPVCSQQVATAPFQTCQPNLTDWLCCVMLCCAARVASRVTGLLACLAMCDRLFSVIEPYANVQGPYVAEHAGS